jgi:hypothetical protein
VSDISRLEQARDAVLACQGYGLAAVTFTVLGGGTADDLRISLLWGPAWPDALPGAIGTIDGLPALLWFRGNGPTTFDAVAAIVTVLSEPGL